MTIYELQTKLYESLKDSRWNEKLKLFILSQDFANILIELYNQSQSGKSFTPIIKDVFKAFRECPYDKLKVVIIGMDPYPQFGVADGIAFSCSYTKKEQPSLRYIFDEIFNTVYLPKIDDNFRIERKDFNPDLTRWCNQGVLLLNTGLTCEIGVSGSHIQLWKPFIIHLLRQLNEYNTGLVYVFLGTKAKEYHTEISSNNYKLLANHPAFAVYSKLKRWDSGNLFNNINDILQKNYGETIIW